MLEIACAAQPQCFFVNEDTAIMNQRTFAPAMPPPSVLANAVVPYLQAESQSVSPPCTKLIKRPITRESRAPIEGTLASPGVGHLLPKEGAPTQDPDNLGDPARGGGADAADCVDCDIAGIDSSEDWSSSSDTDADVGEPSRFELKLETGGGALIDHSAMVHQIVAETGLKPKVVKDVLRKLGFLVIAELRDGNSVKVHRLGTFNNLLRPDEPDPSAVSTSAAERGPRKTQKTLGITKPTLVISPRLDRNSAHYRLRSSPAPRLQGRQVVKLSSLQRRMIRDRRKAIHDFMKRDLFVPACHGKEWEGPGAVQFSTGSGSNKSVPT